MFSLRISCVIGSLLALTLACASHAQDLTQAQIDDMLDDPDFHALSFEIGEAGRLKQNFVTNITKYNADGTTATVKQEIGYDAAYEMIGEETYTVTKTMTKNNLLKLDINGQKLGPAEEKTFVSTLNAFSGLSDYSFTADDSFSPLRFNDWSAHKTKMVVGLKAAYKEAGAPSEVIEGIGMMLEGFMGQIDDESAVTLMVTDNFMAIPHNVGLVLHKPLTGPMQTQSPVGNGVIDGVQSMELTSWDEDANIAHITFDYKPDPKSVNNFLVNVMPTFLKQMGMPDDAVAEFKKELSAQGSEAFMKISTHCDYDVAIDTGFVKKGICTKDGLVTIGGKTGGKTEMYEFSEREL